MCWKCKKTNKLESTKNGNELGGKNNKPLTESTNIDSSVNFVFGGVVIVMLLIVASSGLMFFKACSYEEKCSNLYDEWMKKRESIYSEAIPMDSVLSEIIAVNENQNPKGKNTNANAKKTGGADNYIIPLSEVLKIRESQKLLFKHQEQLTDDIRQETNNIINKMNGWLGFWMGVMAILGVFVPIALQFKLYRENRDNDARLRQEYQKELNRLRKQTIHSENKLETAQRTIQADIKAEFLNMETGINRQFSILKKDYQKEIDKMQSVKFAALIRSFHHIMDSPEIRTNGLRNQLLEENWKEIVNNVSRFIEYYADQTTDIGDAYDMSIILVQVASVLTSLRLLIPRRNRQLESLTMESYNIIQVLNTMPSDREAIMRRLNNYQESLSNLHPMSF